MIRVGYNLFKNIFIIKSKILKISYISKNKYIGYSGGYKSNKKIKVALIPLGYGDGVNRKLSNKAYVKINNHFCKIIGYVCMDVFFVDVTNINCKIDDEVIVLNDIEYWAKICDTIGYEILTNLNLNRLNKKII